MPNRIDVVINNPKSGTPETYTNTNIPNHCLSSSLFVLIYYRIYVCEECVYNIECGIKYKSIVQRTIHDLSVEQQTMQFNGYIGV